ncbi:hypothetical protein LJC11_05715, partial [Bacteroidales bacterium OttesenSCG-928-I21]|nr:hypothetical protein [Bacteroidales bacterium OttesenSCG-928-I21]
KPVFSIHTEYYSTKNLNSYKYRKFFINELLGLDINRKFYKNTIPVMLFFKNGNLIAYPYNIDDIKLNKSYNILLNDQK